MAVRHTSGPWECKTTPTGTWIASEVLNVAFIPGYSDSTENRANARLIAAAPDLLEALKEARKCLRRCHYAGPKREAIDAAILKATGEA